MSHFSRFSIKIYKELKKSEALAKKSKKVII